MGSDLVYFDCYFDLGYFCMLGPFFIFFIFACLGPFFFFFLGVC